MAVKTKKLFGDINKNIKELRMKNLFILGIMLLSILCIVGAAASYTYEGSIDPIIITQWKVISSAPSSEPGVIVVSLVNNSNNHKEIKLAVLYIVNTQSSPMLIAYQIFRTSTKSSLLFELNPITEHYDSVSSFSNGTFRSRWDEKVHTAVSVDRHIKLQSTK